MNSRPEEFEPPPKNEEAPAPELSSPNEKPEAEVPSTDVVDPDPEC